MSCPRETAVLGLHGERQRRPASKRLDNPKTGLTVSIIIALTSEVPMTLTARGPTEQPCRSPVHLVGFAGSTHI